MHIKLDKRILLGNALITNSALLLNKKITLDKALMKASAHMRICASKNPSVFQDNGSALSSSLIMLNVNYVVVQQSDSRMEVPAAGVAHKIGRPAGGLVLLYLFLPSPLVL